jgi:hypothetical protein
MDPEPFLSTESRLNLYGGKIDEEEKFEQFEPFCRFYEGKLPFFLMRARSFHKLAHPHKICSAKNGPTGPGLDL